MTQRPYRDFLTISKIANSGANHKISLKCGCNFIQNKKISLKAQSHLLREIHDSMSRSTKKANFMQLASLFTRILIKNPTIVKGAFTNLSCLRIFEDEKCKEHALMLNGEANGIWYSQASSQCHMPWSYEPVVNGLDAIRRNTYKIWVFSSGVPKADVLSNDINVTLDHQICSNREAPEVEWRHTQLIKSNMAVEILHGVLLEMDKKIIIQSDEDLERTSTSQRSYLWQYNNRVVSPQVHDESLEYEGGVFLKVLGSNIYHFISEDIRPLIMCVESKVRIERVFVRANLPSQFYQLISEIMPEAKITKLERNSTVKVKTLYFTKSTNYYSSNPEAFKENSRICIKELDEYKVWAYLRLRFGIDSREANHRIYLGRSIHDSRGFIREKKLIEYLAKRAVTHLNASDLSVKEQIKLFNATDLLVTSTGASLLNILYLPTGAKVVEIKYDERIGWSFLADAFQMEYQSINAGRFWSKILCKRFDVVLIPPLRKFGNSLI